MSNKRDSYELLQTRVTKLPVQSSQTDSSYEEYQKNPDYDRNIPNEKGPYEYVDLTSATATERQESDRFNEYDYIQENQEPKQPVEEGQHCAIRALPSVPSTTYEALNWDLTRPTTRKVSSRMLRILLVFIFVVIVVVVVCVVLTMYFLNKETTANPASNHPSNGSLFSILGTTANPASNHQSNRSLFTFLSSSHVLEVIPVGRDVWGITVLGNKLFVVPGKSINSASQMIYVYDTTDFKMTRNLAISNESDSILAAIVASSRHNCLYISDIGRHVVHRYNLSNNVVTRWRVGGASYGLSLTNTDNVLVTMYVPKQIKEYTPSGSLVREISLDSSMEAPQHSVQLLHSPDQFLVSHGYTDELHRVCLVNATGDILQSYSSTRQGSSIGQLRDPRQLLIDGHNNVLVSNQGYNRVLMLTPSLTYIGHIEFVIPGEPLTSPWGLYFDQLNGRLYIGEENSSTGRVIVLTVRLV